MAKRLRSDGSRRRMPSRRDIDPIEMKPWLANIQLIDVSHNPRRMVYRLVGEIDVSFRGYNPTGRSRSRNACIGFSAEETAAELRHRHHGTHGRSMTGRIMSAGPASCAARKNSCCRSRR